MTRRHDDQHPDRSLWSPDVIVQDRVEWEDQFGGGWVSDPRPLQHRILDVLAENLLRLAIIVAVLGTATLIAR